MGEPVTADGSRKMSDTLVYNVPSARVAEYRGRRLVVRARTPSEILACLSPEEIANLAYIQLLDADTDVDPLIQWQAEVPLDVVLQDPVTEYPHLYRFARLRETRPVRVSVPVVAGFSRAVKLAVSLQLAVKLEMVRQPDPTLIEELAEVLALYLHQPLVAQPVEWFHSLLLSLYSGEPATLWSLQEEDPAHVRFVTDAGGETISRRFAELPPPPDIDGFVTRLQAELTTRGSECAGCDFWEPCRGYFKWPDESFRCDGVKGLFRTLRGAAGELREDVESARAAQGGQQR
jgi:hypothetical protein